MHFTTTKIRMKEEITKTKITYVRYETCLKKCIKLKQMKRVEENKHSKTHITNPNTFACYHNGKTTNKA